MGDNFKKLLFNQGIIDYTSQRTLTMFVGVVALRY